MKLEAEFRSQKGRNETSLSKFSNSQNKINSGTEKVVRHSHDRQDYLKLKNSEKKVQKVKWGVGGFRQHCEESKISETEKNEMVGKNVS